MTPTDDQAAAIRAMVDWYKSPSAAPTFYLAGYAGVGKSTVAAVGIAELADKAGVENVYTACYTGKAASVLRKKGVASAQTIHSLIYTLDRVGADGKPRFILNRTGPAADADLIVLDECSMVNDKMAGDLLSFGRPILVMGDPGQLPPVNGPGYFTRRVPDVFLTEVHRQAADSPILRLATQARRGERIEVGDYGDGTLVKMLNWDTQDAVYSETTQPICGVHRSRWTITQRLRRMRGFKGNLPRRDETIMCCRNINELGIYNGQVGTMLRDAAQLEPGGPLAIDARMDDRELPIENELVHPYLFRQHFEGQLPRPRVNGLLEFDWGYVLTAHKAQGSEWPHVTIVDDSASFRDDRDRWLYTALTRASEGVTLLKRTM